MIQHPYWVMFATIVSKEITRFTRIWPQTLLPPAITMLLYFIIFGNLIGSRIGTMGGLDYMSFIVPGLIMMSVITNSYGNVSSSFFSNKFQRSIEEMLVAPVPNWVILAGFVGGGMLRGLIVAGIVTLVSLFFTSLQVHSLAVMLLVVLLTAMVFSLAGLINGVFARKFDDISIIPTFVLTPLTYLGGVFFSITLLPSIWQSLAMANPILYMVNAFRYGVHGVSDIPVLWALALLSLLAGVFWFWALRLLSIGKGLKQ